jgi:hypothetical protein
MLYILYKIDQSGIEVGIYFSIIALLGSESYVNPINLWLNLQYSDTFGKITSVLGIPNCLVMMNF